MFVGLALLVKPEGAFLCSLALPVEGSQTNPTCLTLDFLPPFNYTQFMKIFTTKRDAQDTASQCAVDDPDWKYDVVTLADSEWGRPYEWAVQVSDASGILGVL